jgi:redox-sensing transcriptional repressor
VAGRFSVQPVQVRKDLAVTGLAGKPRVGYDLNTLIKAVEDFLGWSNSGDAFIAGAGSLGAALIGYEEFREAGLNIIAAFDCDERKVGQKIKNCEIFHVDRMQNLISRLRVRVGVIAAPAAVAQTVADLMVGGGIRAIWNFAPVDIKEPETVIVENVRLTSSLSSLTRRFKEMTQKEHKTGDTPNG